MNEVIKSNQAQACPQCGKGRTYLGAAGGSHKHGHKHEGRGK